MSDGTSDGLPVHVDGQQCTLEENVERDVVRKDVEEQFEVVPDREDDVWPADAK